RLHLGDVHARNRNRMRLFVRHARQLKSARPDRLDVLGPGIDQRHVVAGAREVAAKISADRARADDCNTLSHFSTSPRNQTSEQDAFVQGWSATPSGSNTCAAARSTPSSRRSPTLTG